MAARRVRPKKLSAAEFEAAVQKKLEKPLPYISDATIGFEMAVFGAVMNYAIKKRYAPVSQRFDRRPKLRRMRRDEFTREEYRALHTKGRKWIRVSIKKDEEGKDQEVTNNAVAQWYRTMTYNMILIACNTGMRPSELKNLCWQDIEPAKDREGREIVVLSVRGKGKARKLVAAKSVGDYLNRVRGQAKIALKKKAEKAAGRPLPEYDEEPKPEDRVFTTIDGKPNQSLYEHLVDDLLEVTKLRRGSGGTARSIYSFRHTYATMRLQEGVDSLLLADQMGTSVKVIQDHYGHVNTVSYAERVLMGINGWDTENIALDAQAAAEEADAKLARAAQARQEPKKPRRSKR
ncbi:MAG: tyrosine-type recombinase/integrase [Sphingomonas sp.]|nr:tyrosine-type recombinase/integrase [Sphingomonas sp.]